MEQLRDDPIIESMLDTGWPQWCQEILSDEFLDDNEQDEMPEQCLTVLNELKIGKKHAVSREKLCMATGLDDRAVRKAIEYLRRTYLILNDQDGTGYYRSFEPQAILRYYHTERARAMSILYRLRPAHRFLKEAGLI